MSLYIEVCQTVRRNGNLTDCVVQELPDDFFTSASTGTGTVLDFDIEVASTFFYYGLMFLAVGIGVGIIARIIKRLIG
jgi:hypothetical protein